MFKKNALLILLVFLSAQVWAQNTKTDKQEVEDIIIKLFDGMREGDSLKVHQVFDDRCRMYTNFISEEGNSIVSEGNLNGFLKAIGTPHEEVWDEQIWNLHISIELGVAQVWCEYAFYVGDQFSHCGIDAFQLIKEEQWKIIQIIDTRRKKDCVIPE